MEATQIRGGLPLFVNEHTLVGSKLYFMAGLTVQTLKLHTHVLKGTLAADCVHVLPSSVLNTSKNFRCIYGEHRALHPAQDSERARAQETRQTDCRKPNSWFPLWPFEWMLHCHSCTKRLLDPVFETVFCSISDF